MVKEIHGAPYDLRISSFKNHDLLGTVEALDAEADAAWGEIYADIRDGKNSIAYWDSQTYERLGFSCFTRYALHRSTKHSGFLQLSVMYVRNGEIIPSMDTQHDSLLSLLKEVPNEATITIR